ncbi:MAG: hemin uptake protein HemP [Planctomycetes bacterium]|nr:hemin uptake protein HemP [Planctomycetota bacterium]
MQATRAKFPDFFLTQLGPELTAGPLRRHLDFRSAPLLRGCAVTATENERSPDRQQDPAPDRHAVHSAARQIDSEQLLHGDREIHICHEGEVYRLRVTRNGKLILHK